jgi:hypothetical protein
MGTDILLSKTLQFCQVGGEFIVTEGHHLAVIETCLLHQLGESAVEKHLADLRLPAQRTLIHLFLHQTRTQRVTQQPLSRPAPPQLTPKTLLNSHMQVLLPRSLNILIIGLQIDLFVEVPQRVFWRIGGKRFTLWGRGRFRRKDMRPAILFRLRVDVISDVRLRLVIQNGIVLVARQSR